MHVVTQAWHVIEPVLAAAGAVCVCASGALAVWGIRSGRRLTAAELEVPGDPELDPDVLLRRWAAEGGVR